MKVRKRPVLQSDDIRTLAILYNFLLFLIILKIVHDRMRFVHNIYD